MSHGLATSAVIAQGAANLTGVGRALCLDLTSRLNSDDWNSYNFIATDGGGVLCYSVDSSRPKFGDWSMWPKITYIILRLRKKTYESKSYPVVPCVLFPGALKLLKCSAG